MKHLGKPPFVCLITAGKLTSKNYESEKFSLIETVRSAVEDGVDLVQIRERDLSSRLLFEITRDVIDALGKTDALVLVNDRPDVALAAGADGVHLRESSISAATVRASFGKDLVIGVSTHDVEAAKSAGASGADFVFFGPVFDSPGKGDPTGTDELRTVCQAVKDFPVIALGGIDAENVKLVFEAGASGVAGIRSMYDPAERRHILSAINARAALRR